MMSSLASYTKIKSLKSRLASGEPLCCLCLMSASPVIADIAGLAGYDFVIIDMEHGPEGTSNALSCVRALDASGTASIIRVPEKSAAWVKKALDLGPQGIMFPMVENARMAEQAVSYCFYPPRGTRSNAHVVVRSSGYGTTKTSIKDYENELLIICMVESIEAVANIEAIASVDGVDAIQFGPRDLSASMGFIEDPGHPKVKEMLREAEKRVLAMQKPGGKGPYLGGIATPHDKPRDLMERGYNMVASGVDVGMFRQFVVDNVERFRHDATLVVSSKLDKNHVAVAENGQKP